MEWLTANWFWLLVFGFFIAMHLFGHGGHGGHGSHGGHGRSEDPRRLDTGEQDARGSNPQTRAGNSGSRKHGHC